MSHPQGSPFDALADDYDRARPTYPDALFDQLERLAGPLGRKRVIDVGAGTGIASRGLAARGAQVVAADVGEKMLGRLRMRSPGLPAVLADGHALPFARNVADLVCFAQTWHWMRPQEAAREVVRVLRPQGALAVWWNSVDARDQQWWQNQVGRIEAANPSFSRDYRDRPYAEELLDTGLFISIRTTSFRWKRNISLDDYLAWLRSKAYVMAVGEHVGQFLEEERASLKRFFPSGVVEEPFRTDLIVARHAS